MSDDASGPEELQIEIEHVLLAKVAWEPSIVVRVTPGESAAVAVLQHLIEMEALVDSQGAEDPWPGRDWRSWIPTLRRHVELGYGV